MKKSRLISACIFFPISVYLSCNYSRKRNLCIYSGNISIFSDSDSSTSLLARIEKRFLFCARIWKMLQWMFADLHNVLGHFFL